MGGLRSTEPLVFSNRAPALSKETPPSVESARITAACAAWSHRQQSIAAPKRPVFHAP
jgi:hypothetical protein